MDALDASQENFNSVSVNAQIAKERAKVLECIKRYNLSLSHFTQVHAWKSSRYFLGCYGALIFTFLVWKYAFAPWSWLVLVFIPFIQHAFFNTVHEASHYFLHSNERKNDFLGNFFAFPIGTTVESYRAVHFDHHRYLNSEKDPSSVMTTYQGQSHWKVIRGLVLGLCGRYLFLLVLSLFKKTPSSNSPQQAQAQKRRFLQMVIFHVSLLIFAVHQSAFVFWFIWVVSANSLLPFLESVRTLVEHRRTHNDLPTMHTRSHHRSVLLSAFTAPFFQYHWEHHLFPTMPHYNLKELHDLLKKENLPEIKPVSFYRTFFQIITDASPKK